MKKWMLCAIALAIVFAGVTGCAGVQVKQYKNKFF